MSSSLSAGKMGTSQITFFCICAVIVLGTLTASVSLDLAGLALWAIAIVLFVIPNMMIISELGTTYPAEGGIYDWIRRAFGKRISTRAIYLYWVSNGIWMALLLDHINLVSGVTDAISPLFGDNSPVVLIITVLFMLCIVGDQVTWSMAPAHPARTSSPGAGA